MQKRTFLEVCLPFCLTLVVLVVYMMMLATGIYGGDAGELVSAAYTFGIAHPPGYPLYMLLSGLLAHVLPIQTVAWRVGILSALSMAGSCYFMYMTLIHLTKKWIVATITTLFYAFLYPIWLYAIVAEVFGLYALFSALFIYLFVRWIDTKERKLLYGLALLTGLAMTHQYVIIFGVAAAGFVVYRFDPKTWTFIIQKKLSFLGALGIGYLPVLYAPLASLFNPIFDREHAASILGFLRLISRVSTGGFRASSVATGGIFNGLMDVTTFAQYLYKDFTFVGIALAGIGFYWLWKKGKLHFSFFLVYLSLLLFFLLYAGFPVMNNFQIGTLERFFIVPYQILAILMGLGLSYGLQLYTTVLLDGRKQFYRVYTWLLPVFWIMIILLFPFSALKKNYQSLALLKSDRTMERYADDILRSIPEGALFGVYQDTTAGAINYALYVQKKRSDIVYINYYLLSREYYRKQLALRFPRIIFPNHTTDTFINDYISKFILVNEKQNIILSDVELPGISGYWVPNGLVYAYFSTIESIPDRQLILDKNNRLWQAFTDPLSGSLGTYKHLLLSDVLRNYADHALAIARAQSLVGNYEESQKYLLYALGREVTMRVDVYRPLIDQLIDGNKCAPARNALDAIYTKWGDDFVILEGYHIFMKKCSVDDDRLESIERQYQKLKPVYDAPLQ